ncbi:MAG: hypothetical protein JXR54_08200 [Tannerellaceae bacterium]|nr:hypothetical protein [Tannerellaceae bacterium]
MNEAYVYHCGYDEGALANDKKMLWRANLYIDEEGTDWNNAHPWDSEDNAWLTIAGTDGATVNGGQIDIKDWTHFWDGTTPVRDAVAYGWGGNDNAGDFNTDMTNLQSTVSACFSQTGSPHPEWADHGVTTAPGGNWSNYIFSARRRRNGQYEVTKDVYAPYQFYDYGTGFSTGDLQDVTQHTYYSNTSSINVPGLSTFLAYVTDERNPALSVASYPRNYEADQVNFTAGLDCSGLAERSADYQGSGYIVTGGNETKNKVSASMIIQDNNSWQLAVNGRNENKLLLSRLVPGDIVINNGHVMIVQNVEYSGMDRDISNLEQITLIHSVRSIYQYDDIWRIAINPCRSASYSSYQFRRLRSQQ